VQEAWLLGTARSEISRDAKLSTWLVRIVVNEAIGRARQAAAGGEVIQLSGESLEDRETVRQI